MTSNDILRRLCFALRLSDRAMLGMLELAGATIDSQVFPSYFKQDDEEGFVECPRTVLADLLDGMIVKYRGRKDEATDTSARPKPQAPLDNNAVLKKIRIALSLREDDMMAIMKLAGLEVSKNELSALFRDRGHKNYKECMDQFLRNFLAGLAKYSPSLPLEKD
ncbi:MAG: DUF1456 domain-containing protein [Spirochaetae bacterium HGW-Spirochaetae-7]|jgi:uncharacterized protein YehS (DUF1456 family)|nr:MAG: DUF1456 domain-containing protein [Spirochaetae bacterium HGW-Spirochaetae-7]